MTDPVTKLSLAKTAYVTTTRQAEEAWRYWSIMLDTAPKAISERLRRDAEELDRKASRYYALMQRAYQELNEPWSETKGDPWSK